MPRSNLILNIGFGPGATQTTTAESKLAGLPVAGLVPPLLHPSQVRQATWAATWTEADAFGITARPTLKHIATSSLGTLRRALARARNARRVKT